MYVYQSLFKLPHVTLKTHVQVTTKCITFKKQATHPLLRDLTFVRTIQPIRKSSLCLFIREWHVLWIVCACSIFKGSLSNPSNWHVPSTNWPARQPVLTNAKPLSYFETCPSRIFFNIVQIYLQKKPLTLCYASCFPLSYRYFIIHEHTALHVCQKLCALGE